MAKMQLTFLGTGTSNGVPVIGCHCAVCDSKDPRDHRLRTAALLETASTRILIDCGPDIRQQLMPLPFRKIDAVLLTHAHYDHVGGLDDLRPFCRFSDIPMYGNEPCVKAVRHNFPYCFSEHLYPGVPKIELHTLHKEEALRVGDIDVLPIEVMHDKLSVLGYRFGSLGYITDMKNIDDNQLALLEGVDTLVVNGLRWEKPHHSHQLIPDAVAMGQRLDARRTFIIHVTHDVGLYDQANARLPEGCLFPFDGMKIKV